MSLVILARHGRSVANGSAVLAGRMPGVGLDPTGEEQARSLVDRLAGIPLAALVSSPLQRCRETLAPLAAARGREVTADEELIEVDYGAWTGRALAELAALDAWATVRHHPSAMVFPGGEAMAAMAARAVRAARRHAAVPPDAPAPGETAPGEAAGAERAVLLCTHGDVIKAIVADALGMHLDLFQRLHVAPGSLSVIRYATGGAMVVHLNVPGPLPGDLAAAPVQATVGGDPGTSAPPAQAAPVS